MGGAIEAVEAVLAGDVLAVEPEAGAVVAADGDGGAEVAGGLDVTGPDEEDTLLAAGLVKVEGVEVLPGADALELGGVGGELGATPLVGVAGHLGAAGGRGEFVTEVAGLPEGAVGFQTSLRGAKCEPVCGETL